MRTHSQDRPRSQASSSTEASSRKRGPAHLSKRSDKKPQKASAAAQTSPKVVATKEVQTPKAKKVELSEIATQTPIVKEKEKTEEIKPKEGITLTMRELQEMMFNFARALGEQMNLGLNIDQISRAYKAVVKPYKGSHRRSPSCSRAEKSGYDSGRVSKLDLSLNSTM